MTELNNLPPDQRAVLSLVLDRGKSYSEVADMLAIPESAVRDRAHAALDALGGTAPRGERGTGGAHDTPRTLGSLRQESAAGSRETGTREPGPRRASASPGALRSSGPSRAARTSRAPSSRRNGALLLAAIVIVVVLVVVLISSGGKKGSGNTASTSTGSVSSTSSSSKTTTGTPKLDHTIKLTPFEPSLKAAGEAYVLSESGRRAFYVAIQGLPQSPSGSFYAVWLYTSPSRAAPLGRAPNVNSSGRMEGGGPLPNNAGSYQQLIITRETSTHPTHPGPILLRGTFALK
jgi:hypothetical protein